MNIAFFSDVFYPELSGIAETTFLTGSELARRGHHVDYYVPYYTDYEYELAGVALREPQLPHGARVFRLPARSFPGPTGMGRAVWPNLLDGVRTREHYDMVHVHSFFGAGVDALTFARRRRIPLVGTNHTYVESFLAYSPVRFEWVKKLAVWYVRWFHDRCALVSTPSKFLTTHMKETGSRVPMVTVSNPVAKEFFVSRGSKEELKRELGLEGTIILYVGRLAKEKNVMTLLHAFVQLAKGSKDAQLVFVGMGPEREPLLEGAQQAKLDKRVRLLGPYLGENKQKLYDLFHCADIFAFPSTSDTQGMVLLEAFAAETPAVVSRIGPLPELVAENRGLSFEPGNVSELTEALQKLSRDPVLRSIMGKKARAFAEQFSVDAIANEWEKLYRNVLVQAKK